MSEQQAPASVIPAPAKQRTGHWLALTEKQRKFICLLEDGHSIEDARPLVDCTSVDWQDWLDEDAFGIVLGRVMRSRIERGMEYLGREFLNIMKAQVNLALHAKSQALRQKAGQALIEIADRELSRRAALDPAGVPQGQASSSLSAVLQIVEQRIHTQPAPPVPPAPVSDGQA